MDGVVNPETPRVTRMEKPRGIRAFTIIWIGQMVSLLGSSMSLFAITIWAWNQTGRATTLALLSLSTFLTSIAFSPFAGVLVDRWNRKLVMMLSDLGTALATIAVLFLYATGKIQIWHLYLVGILAGVFMSFQYPAFTAAITILVHKDHYARASGMTGIGESLVEVLAPMLAAALLGVIGIVGILLIDIATYLAAFGTLIAVPIPQPKRSSEQPPRSPGLWKDTLFGFRYILTRPSLLVLQVAFLGGNFFEGLSLTILAPMILARSGEITLGSVLSLGALGGVLGGALMSVWGGPRRKIRAVLLGWAISNVFGITLMGLGRGIVLWTVANFLFAFLTPIVDGADQSFWQAKVAPDVQGRVFGTRIMLLQLPGLFARSVAGPLADWVFEPAMMPGGGLASTLGWLVGTGRGAGMSLMLVIAGALGTLIVVGAYALRPVRRAEALLPDHGSRTSAAI
jgi:MFS family permease